MKTRFTPVSAEEAARDMSEHLAVGAAEYFAEHPEVLRAIVLSLIKLGSKFEAAEPRTTATTRRQSRKETVGPYTSRVTATSADNALARLPCVSTLDHQATSPRIEMD